MFKKGIIHLIPLVVLALVFSGALTFFSFRHENNQKLAVGKVLSSSDRNKNEEHKTGNSSVTSSVENREGRNEDEDNDGNKSSKTESLGNTAVKVDQKNDESKKENEKNLENKEIKVRVKNENGKFETGTEGEKQETKIETRNLKIEYETENGKVVIKFKNEQDKEVELEDKDKEDLLENVENELEDEDIKLATDSAEPGFVQHGRKVRTHFPLSVNPLTGELYVTTPAGEKVVIILPDVAVANMIRAGIMTRVDGEPQPGALPSPGEGTEGAQPGKGSAGASVAGATIQLTEANGEPVYEISGVSDQHFLGLIPVDIKLKAKIAVADGHLVDIEQGFFAKLLDLFSF